MDEGVPDSIEVTVTFLEMEAPPAHAPALPYNRQIALLKAKDMPLHFYRYLADRVGRKWHWVNILRMSDEELAAGIHHEDREISVLYLDGSPAGFFDIKPHLPDEVELAYFGMMEHATGQGLGRWFLGTAISACWALGPKRVTVQTCTLDHPAALPLYQKLGFNPVGQKKEIVHPLPFAERSASVMRP
ncbi:acetyltransferase [Mesorhizobium sp. Root552]|jgi:GNAT superfamily N-acetyltransferase|uniref:GNAT family N-acetyltransferase n=1 Tax=Mesorhizobium sp. Root552 TaxID=1736555 RepID=UPI0006F4B048|nr:GNAT family N-acetyltransferase [Mesorhizobium sp. Root552]KQZ21854.1 acetyltransferase [Mesorhizobium sp. Root552]